MNPHRCKILCDKPFESPLCHRNDTTEHIATRRKAILPRRKVIRAMPSEPFVSTASYAVCPHPLRYGPALSYPTPRPVSFGSSPALPDGAQTVPATASRTGRLFPAAAPSDMKLSKLKCRPDTNTGPNTGHPEPRKAPKPPDRSAPDTNISPNKNADRIRTSPRAQTPARTRKNQPERYETFRAGACGLMKTFICQFWSL